MLRLPVFVWILCIVTLRKCIWWRIATSVKFRMPLQYKFDVFWGVYMSVVVVAENQHSKWGWAPLLLPSLYMCCGHGEHPASVQWLSWYHSANAPSPIRATVMCAWLGRRCDQDNLNDVMHLSLLLRSPISPSVRSPRRHWDWQATPCPLPFLHPQLCLSVCLSVCLFSLSLSPPTHAQAHHATCLQSNRLLGHMQTAPWVTSVCVCVFVCVCVHIQAWVCDVRVCVFVYGACVHVCWLGSACVQI